MRFLRRPDHLTTWFENDSKEYAKREMSNNGVDNSDKNDDLSKSIVEAINEFSEQNEMIGSFFADSKSDVKY